MGNALIDAVYYFVFVLVPVFLLGFQALLLAVIFFLKGRRWLSLQAFAVAGALTGVAFGYLFGRFSGAETLWVPCISVTAFGAISAAGWWYLLVKREATRAST